MQVKGKMPDARGGEAGDFDPKHLNAHIEKMRRELAERGATEEGTDRTASSRSVVDDVEIAVLIKHNSVRIMIIVICNCNCQRVFLEVPLNDSESL